MGNHTSSHCGIAEYVSYSVVRSIFLPDFQYEISPHPAKRLLDPDMCLARLGVLISNVL